jgi:hypothetical protein
MAILPAMAVMVAPTLRVAWLAARLWIHGDPPDAVRHS